jgi:hypothetical protein
MGRLIEIPDAQALPPSVTVDVGDLLCFAASGGHVQSGADVVEMLGPFLPGVLRDNGEILSPMGAPNTVFFFARRPGRATIDVVTGDPWHAPQTTTLQITVAS